jgi:uncharacterized membrane protein YdjX (TVP38/TMEM64 family)
MTIGLRSSRAHARAARREGPGRLRWPSRYWTVAGAMAALLLTAFVVVAAFGNTVLTEPEDWLEGPFAGILGVALLVADSVLPIASSVVMVSLGALYGPLGGVALALLGRLGCFLAGFAVGRRMGARLLRAVPATQRERAEELLARRGAFAVVVTRPLPILGDTVAILAGASPMSWRRGAVAATVGSVPEAVAYAAAGSLAASSADAAVVWAAFIVVAGAFWVAAGRAARVAKRARATGGRG